MSCGWHQNAQPATQLSGHQLTAEEKEVDQVLSVTPVRQAKETPKLVWVGLCSCSLMVINLYVCVCLAAEAVMLAILASSVFRPHHCR